MIAFDTALSYYNREITAKQTDYSHPYRIVTLQRFCTMIKEAASAIKPEDSLEIVTNKLNNISKIIDEARNNGQFNDKDKRMLYVFPVLIEDAIAEKRKSAPTTVKMHFSHELPVKKSPQASEHKEPSEALPASNATLLEEISKGNTKNTLEILKSPFNQWQIDEKSPLARYQYTPLILCAAKGTHALGGMGVITELLRLEANVSMKDSQHRTALHYACLHKDSKLISALVAKGAQWDIKDKNGQTALDFLFLGRQDAAAILENAIEKKKDTVPFALAEASVFSGNKRALLDSLIPDAIEGLPEIILAKAAVGQKLLQALEPFKKYMDTVVKNSSGPASSASTASFFSKNELSEWLAVYAKLHTIATSMSTDNLYSGPNEFVYEYDDKKLKLANLIKEKIQTTPPGEIMRTLILSGQEILKVEINEKAFKASGPESEYKSFGL